MFRKRIQLAQIMAKSIPEKIHAIHDDDLESFLDSLGLLKSLKKGDLKCKFCNEIITLDSFYSIFPDSGEISIVCKKDQCIHAFLEYRNK